MIGHIMSGTICLIGGGQLSNGDTRLIDEDILALAPEGSTFVFFGFAARDSSEYINAIASVYGGKYNVVVPTVAKGRDFAIDAIKSAAVIYLGEALQSFYCKYSPNGVLPRIYVLLLNRGRMSQV